MKLDRCYISPYFVTNTKTMTCELENPLILTMAPLHPDSKELN